MTPGAFPELGFYALAGEADSSRDLLQEVERARRWAWGRCSSRSATTRSAACGRRLRWRSPVHRGHQQTHPLVTAGFARTQSLSRASCWASVGASRWPWASARSGRDGGLRRADAPAVPGRDGAQRRTGRALSVPAPRLVTRRASAHEPWPSGPTRFGSRAALRRGGAAHVPPTDGGALRRAGPAEQAGRDPADGGCGRAATVGDHLPYEDRLVWPRSGDLPHQPVGSAALQRFQGSPVMAGRRGAIDAGASVRGTGATG